MKQAKNGDSVKVHYTGKLDDGTVFDSSEKRNPLEFIIGNSQIIPGFEQSIVGMKPGESKVVEIPQDKAYGPHREEMVLAVDLKQVPQDIKLEIGQKLQIPQADGRKILVTVTDISKEKVKLDANHPLAGKDLIFEVHLVEIL